MIGKNKRKINGIPLIFFTFAQAVEIVSPPNIIVSTDDIEILSWTKKLGFVEYGLRPKNMSSSTSPDIDWLQYTYLKLKNDVKEIDEIVLLRPTSPFRTNSFIQNGLQSLRMNEGVSSVRAVRKCKEHPGKMWRLYGDTLLPLLPFGDVPWHSQQYKSLPEIYVQTASLEILRPQKTIERGMLAGETISPIFGSDLDNFDINLEDDMLDAEKLIKGADQKVIDKANELYDQI